MKELFVDDSERFAHISAKWNLTVKFYLAKVSAKISRKRFIVTYIHSVAISEFPNQLTRD